MSQRRSQAGRWAAPATLVPILFLLGASAASAKPAELPLAWAPARVAVDGNGAEWAPDFGTFFKSESVQVGARSDSVRLYVLVRFRASTTRWAMPCAMTGLTLWLDPKAGTKKSLGLQLADGPVLELPGFGGRPPDGESMPARRAPRGRDGNLRLFAEETTIVARDGSDGPAAAFLDTGGMCTYEFTVPLDSSNDSLAGIGVQPGQALTFCVTAGVSEQERQQMHGPGQQGERGQGPGGGFGGPPAGDGMGGGRPGPGGMGGRPGGGPPAGRPAMSNPALWLSVRLASEPPAPAVEPNGGEK
jgi:hypothetical protein